MLQNLAEGMMKANTPLAVQAADVLNSETLTLKDFMKGSSQGWGREQGRAIYGDLLTFVENKPGTLVFFVSLSGVERMDISFASESVVELARRFRGSKGFAMTDVADADMLENLEAAAARKHQPLVIRMESNTRVLGMQPSRGNTDAFQFVQSHQTARAAQFAAANNMPIANASMKFKQLWEQGFLLRRESVAESGGVEFVYFRIG
jgi:hypothetical protein